MRRPRAALAVVTLAALFQATACTGADPADVPMLRYRPVTEPLCADVRLNDAAERVGWGRDPRPRALDRSDKYQTEQTCVITPTRPDRTRRSQILVQVSVSELRSERGLELFRENAYDPGDGTDPEYADITGWWDDGFSVRANELLGSAFVGYKRQVWVVDGNASVTVDVASSARRGDEQTRATIDRLIAMLLDRAHDYLQQHRAAPAG